MCIPEMSFFLVAVKDGNGTMCFCGVLWPIVCFVVAHCNLFHTSIVMQNITMSRGCSICELSPGRRFEFLGDREGHPICIDLTTSPSTSVGARAADVGLGGPLGSPASCSSGIHVGGTRPHPTPRATLKALPTPHRPPSPLRTWLRFKKVGQRSSRAARY